MNKILIIFLLFLFVCPFVFGDVNVLQGYKQQFSRVDLPAKVNVLNNAVSDSELNESVVLFYEYALNFALGNSEVLKNDPDMINIINTAISGLQNTAKIKDNDSLLDVLWKLLLEYPDSVVGAEILITIGRQGSGNSETVSKINDFLFNRNIQFRSGESVNYSVISACITAIMEMDDSSSYPVLFQVMCFGYPEVIAFEAYGAMELISGDLKQFCLM